MSLRWIWFLMCIGAVLMAAGCHLGESRSDHRWNPTCVGCQEAMPVNGWCSPCDHGLVAGRIIPSRQFHELLDAHGHEVEISTLQCGMCRVVAPHDGFCSRCRNGFVAGQLYFSELTWALAGGVQESRGIDCRGCLELIEDSGRCPHCLAHWVGSVRFVEAEPAAIAAHQFERLKIALQRLERCEECALAGFFGTRCRVCGQEPIPDPLK